MFVVLYQCVKSIGCHVTVDGLLIFLRGKRAGDNGNRWRNILSSAENMWNEIMHFGVHKWLVFQQMTQKCDKMSQKWRKNIFLACNVRAKRVKDD